MTRAELISAVQAKTWFVNNIGPIQMENDWPKTMPSGDTIQLERAHVLVENPANTLYSRHIRFYTIQLGQPEEAAYYAEEDVDVQAGVA